MGASAVPIPPVASAPALQCVSTVAPSGTSGSPASPIRRHMARSSSQMAVASARSPSHKAAPSPRSEEHTSELQSQSNLVCRLLLEKKKIKKHTKLLAHIPRHIGSTPIITHTQLV